MRRIEKFVLTAKKQALKSSEPNRHGCIIFRRNKVLSLGYNKSKTHTVASNHYSKCLHAEIDAIVSCKDKDLQGSELLVCRVYKRPEGKLGMSKPCKHCMDIINSSGIKKIHYTNNLGEVETIKL